MQKRIFKAKIKKTSPPEPWAEEDTEEQEKEARDRAQLKVLEADKFLSTLNNHAW